MRPTLPTSCRRSRLSSSPTFRLLSPKVVLKYEQVQSGLKRNSNDITTQKRATRDCDDIYSTMQDGGKCVSRTAVKSPHCAMPRTIRTQSTVAGKDNMTGSNPHYSPSRHTASIFHRFMGALTQEHKTTVTNNTPINRLTSFRILLPAQRATAPAHAHVTS